MTGRIITFVLGLLVLAVMTACSTSPPETETPPTASGEAPTPGSPSPPSDDFTVWQFSDKADGTLQPDRLSTFDVTDGQVLVSLIVPPQKMESAQNLSVQLVNEQIGRRLVFTPPLRLSHPATILITPRAGEALFPFVRIAEQHQVVQYEMQGSATSVTFEQADSLWFGDVVEAGQIYSEMTIPAGVDCMSVSSLNDLQWMGSLFNMQQAIGVSTTAPVDVLEAIARRAAKELKRILGEDLPPEACGHYLSSLLAFARIVDAIGFFDVDLDMSKIETRVKEVLDQCEMKYELTWNGSQVRRADRFAFWSRIPNRGILGAQHQTPHLLDGIGSGSEGSTSFALDSDVTLNNNYDISDPLQPRTIFTVAGIKGEITLSGAGIDPIVIDFETESGGLAFPMTQEGVGLQGYDKLIVTSPGVLEIHIVPADFSRVEWYAFELKKHSLLILYRNLGNSVMTTTASLFIPELEDLDDTTKLLCEGVVASQ